MNIPKQLESLNLAPCYDQKYNSKTKKSEPMDKAPGYSILKYKEKGYWRNSLKKKIKEGANVLLITGKQPDGRNIAVIDPDSQAVADIFKDEDTFTVKTPSGGYHYYYETEEPGKSHMGYKNLQMEIKDDSNGYVIVPPSTYKNGGYEIVNDAPIKKIKGKMVDYVNKLIPIQWVLIDEKIESHKKKVKRLLNNQGINCLKVLEDYYGPEKYAQLEIEDDGHGKRLWNPLGQQSNSTKSFCYNPSKDIWFLHSFNQGGDIIDLVMELEDLSEPKAIEWLTEKYNVDYKLPSNYENGVVKIFKESYKGTETYHELQDGKPYKVVYKTVEGNKIVESKKSLLDIQISEATVIEPINEKISTSRYTITCYIRNKKVVFEARTQAELVKELQEKYSVNIQGNPRNTIVALCELIHTQAEEEGRIIKAMGKPGIYWYNNKVQIEGYEPPNPTKLKSALVTLDTLIYQSYHKNQYLYKDVILWAIAAFTSFARKQLKHKPYVPHFLQYGPRDIGKSEFIEIAMHMFVEDPSLYERSGSGFKTDARRRAAVGEGTWPCQVEEISYRDIEGLEDDLKESYNSQYLKTQNPDQTTTYSLSLSPVYLSTNILPDFRDEAFGKRVILMPLGPEHQIPAQDRQNYQRIKSKLQQEGKIKELVEIGKYLAYQIQQTPSLLRTPWDEIGYEMLTFIYDDLKLEKPEWLKPMSETLNIENSIKTIRDQGEEQTILLLSRALKNKSEYLVHHIRHNEVAEAKEEIINIAADGRTRWLYMKRDGTLVISAASLEKDINSETGTILPTGSIHNILQDISETKLQRVKGLGKPIRGYNLTVDQLYEILIDGGEDDEKV